MPTLTSYLDSLGYTGSTPPLLSNLDEERAGIDYGAPQNQAPPNTGSMPYQELDQLWAQQQQNQGQNPMAAQQSAAADQGANFSAPPPTPAPQAQPEPLPPPEASAGGGGASTIPMQSFGQPSADQSTAAVPTGAFPATLGQPGALPSPEAAMPANDRLQSDIERLRKERPSLGRSLLAALAAHAPIVGGTLAARIADPQGLQRAIGIDTEAAKNEDTRTQREAYVRNQLSEAEKRRIDALEAQQRIDYLRELAKETSDRRTQAASAAFAEKGGVYASPETQQANLPAQPEPLPSLEPSAVTPQGPQQPTAQVLPGAMNPAARQAALARLAQQVPQAPQGPDGIPGVPQSTALPPVTVPAKFRVPPGSTPVPNAPGTPQGAEAFQLSPKDIAEQKKQGALDAANANAIQLPAPVAQAFGMDPATKVDPAHLPAYLTAYTTYQNAETKSEPEKVKQRQTIADSMPWLQGRDRDTYILEGKMALTPPGEQGTWQLQEDEKGNTVQFNTKTGAVRPAEGVQKSGTKSKADAAKEKEIGPARDALAYGQNYVNNGVYTGPGDEALQEKFFELAKPTTGFRMTQPQMDMLKNGRSMIQGVFATGKHLANGTWFDDKQRQQIVSTMAELAKAKGISPAAAAGEPARTKVRVQIPGQPPGEIPAENLDQFKKAHPDATVL